MVRLQFLLASPHSGKLSFQPGGAPSGSTDHGKLSFCLCCCDGLDLIPFHLHFIPVDNMCPNFGQSVGMSDPLQWQTGSNCDDWEYSTPGMVGLMECDDPTGEAPRDDIDATIEMYCTEHNRFRLNLCLAHTVTDPVLPDDCDNLWYGLEGVQSQDICEIAEDYRTDPGYIPGSNAFTIDFGEINYSFCSDGCDFRVIVNDVLTPPILASMPPGWPASPVEQDPLPAGVEAWLASGDT